MMMRDPADVSEGPALTLVSWIHDKGERSDAHGGSVSRGSLTLGPCESPMRSHIEVTQGLQGASTEPAKSPGTKPQRCRNNDTAAVSELHLVSAALIDDRVGLAAAREWI
jgi:hypothetical protein